MSDSADVDRALRTLNTQPFRYFRFGLDRLRRQASVATEPGIDAQPPLPPPAAPPLLDEAPPPALAFGPAPVTVDADQPPASGPDGVSGAVDPSPLPGWEEAGWQEAEQPAPATGPFRRLARSAPYLPPAPEPPSASEPAPTERGVLFRRLSGGPLPVAAARPGQAQGEPAQPRGRLHLNDAAPRGKAASTPKLPGLHDLFRP